VAHYRVYLRGENFLLVIDGTPTRLGFYTTRFVQASDRDGAELLAVDLIRRELENRIRNERSDSPMIFAEKIDVVDGVVPQISSGFAFFPMDSSGADDSDA
jgi:hypothetical protein